MKKIYTLFVSLCLLTLALNAQVAPQNSPYANNNPVGLTKMDSVMGATPANLLVFRPALSLGGPFPTILFQPGANAAPDTAINWHSYDLYAEHLASYGYVVLIINNTTGGPNATLFTQTHDWIKDSVANASHWMHNYIDTNRFVVAGHSNGGMNATDIIIDRPAEIKAIMYLASYPNPGIAGFGAQDVSTYPGKVLFLNGTEDSTSATLVGATNDVSRSSFDGSFTAASCKVRVLFSGMGHGAFGDYVNPAQPVGTIGRADATASVRHYLVSFLKTVIETNGTADQNLNAANKRLTSVLEFESTCGIGGSTVGIEYVFGSSAVVGIYPNPANNQLNVNLNVPSSGDVRFQIINITGQVVYSSQSTLVENQDNINTIDIQNLNNGIYILNIEQNGKSFHSKFIKE